jgi:HEAT repeat protein
LIAALEDEDSLVRGNAAQALGRIQGPRTVDPLIKALTDEHKYVRGKAAEALGAIRDPRTVDPLIAALEHDEEARAFVILALYRIADARCFEAIRLLTKDMDLMNALSAYRAGGTIPEGGEWILIAALFRHGGVRTAQAFLNSGNSLLFSAAGIWVNHHPQYTIKFNFKKR